MAVGGDSISARGRSRRRRVRRDGASRPTAARTAAAIPVCRALAVDRRGGIYPARRRSRRRGVPGTMRASSPTEVCYNVGMSFPGWPRAPSGCRGGPWPSRGTLRRRKPGRYLRPKSRTCGLWPPKRACGRSRIGPYRVAGSRGLRLPGIPARKKMKKIPNSSFLIPHSLPVPNFKPTPPAAAPCRSRRQHRRR